MTSRTHLYRVISIAALAGACTVAQPTDQVSRLSSTDQDIDSCSGVWCQPSQKWATQNCQDICDSSYYCPELNDQDWNICETWCAANHPDEILTCIEDCLHTTIHRCRIGSGPP